MQPFRLASLLCGATIAFSALAGCATSENPGQPETSNAPVIENGLITISDAAGDRKFPYQPNKIVSFDFGAMDTLNSLDVPVEGFPRASLPAYLTPSADPKAINIGGMKEPDMAALTEAKPDLIVISRRLGDQREKLEAIAPVLGMDIDPENYLDSVLRNAEILGQITGKSEEAQEKIDRVRWRAQVERSEVQQASTLKTLVVLYYKGKFFPRNDAVIYQVLDATPAPLNIAPPKAGERPHLTPAQILAANPDILFVLDRGAAVGEKPMDPALLKSGPLARTAAGRHGRIVALRPDLWYLSGGGLQSLLLQAEEASAIYKSVE